MLEATDVARLHGPRDIRIHRERVAQPAGGEVLLRVGAVGICGSDLHWWGEASIGDARLTRPLILGHEIAGEIAYGPQAGRRVVIEPAIPCRTCDECRTGRGNLCQASRFAGHGTTDGGLRGWMSWPEDLVQAIPDDVSDVEAVLLEPAAIAVHAVDLGGLTPGSRVGVFGCGPLGLLIVQWLARQGLAGILATDPLPHRAAAAARMGATDVVVSAPGVDFDRASSVDVAIEVAGTDAAVADAMQATRPGGRVVLVGIPSGDRTSFPAGLARRKGLSLLLCRRSRPGDLETAVSAVEDGAFDLGGLVSDRVPLADVARAFSIAETRGGLKVVVEP